LSFLNLKVSIIKEFVFMVFKIALLTLIWVVLRESFSIVDIIIGMFISIACIWYSQKFIPLSHVKGINFFALVKYAFYLIGQIYIAGFYVIKMILFGATTYIVTVKTNLINETLKIILADSITLTPGSVLLDLTKDNITVVWLRSKNEKHPPQNADELIKGQLEKKLLCMQEESTTNSNR